MHAIRCAFALADDKAGSNKLAEPQAEIL